MGTILFLLAGLLWVSPQGQVNPPTTDPAQQSRTSQEPEAQRKTALTPEQCTALVGAEEAALAKEDWPSLQAIAHERIARCKGVQDAEPYSSAYHHLAVANIEQKRSRQALPLLDTCIQIHYLNCQCHVERVNALAQLGRLADARTEARLARLLIPQQRALLERQLPTDTASLSYSDQARADSVKAALADLDGVAEFLESLEKSLAARGSQPERRPH